MITVAEQAGVTLSAPCVGRYHPVAFEMKKLIELKTLRLKGNLTGGKKR